MADPVAIDPTTGYPIYAKDTVSVVDYALELEDYLASHSDAIDQLLSVVVEAPLTLDSQAISGTRLVAWLSGGAPANQKLSVRFDWSTVGGRVDGQTILIEMKVK